MEIDRTRRINAIYYPRTLERSYTTAERDRQEVLNESPSRFPRVFTQSQLWVKTPAVLILFNEYIALGITARIGSRAGVGDNPGTESLRRALDCIMQVMVEEGAALRTERAWG